MMIGLITLISCNEGEQNDAIHEETNIETTSIAITLASGAIMHPEYVKTVANVTKIMEY